MAAFCKKCSIETFGEDSKDLAGLGRYHAEALKPGEGYHALCEGCYHKGLCLVDDTGFCLIREDMEKNGDYQEGIMKEWVYKGEMKST